jgi:hypothetical protein
MSQKESSWDVWSPHFVIHLGEKMVVHLGDVLMNSGIKDIILVPGQRSDAGH